MRVPIELKLKYLERRILDLQALKTSLECDDFSYAQRLGHQVKGNALTFEFPGMAGLGLEMEIAAREQDKERIVVLAKKMEKEIIIGRGEIWQTKDV